MPKPEASRALLVSSFIVAVGIILLLSSYIADAQLSLRSISPFLRDLGIAVSSTGLISVTYEVLLRSQLLEDHVKAIKGVLNPDAERLGISHIFGNRQEAEIAGFGVETLIENAKTEVVIYGIAPVLLLVERAGHLHAFLKRGGKLRLLLSRPRGRNLLAIDESLGSSPGALISDVDSVLRELRKLSNAVRGTTYEQNLSVKWHDNVPSFGLIGIDVASSSGILLVEFNGLRRGESERPTLQLSPRAGGGLYELYFHELEAIWQSATAARSDVAPSNNLLLNEYGVCVGWQSDLYDKALRLARERSITSAVFYHYSGSIIQNDVQEFLQQGCAVELVTQAPTVAMNLNALEQVPRISGMVAQMKTLSRQQKARLTLRQSKVPNSVRAAVFGDELIVLGWYYYSQFPDDSEVRVGGHQAFGVLIECENTAAFQKAREFIASYADGLAAEVVAL